MLDLSHTLAKIYFKKCKNVWQILPMLKSLIVSIGENLGEEYRQISPCVWVHESAVVCPTAHIEAPCIVGAKTEIRHCAFIRGAALIGEGCVVGNSTEIKNSVLFDRVKVPHFNYIGDSVLGYRAHLGAGTIISNVKSDKSPITVKNGDSVIYTRLKKFGAVVGDYVEVGCNCVLNPGTIIGKHSRIYPLSCVRGVVPPDRIYKTPRNIVEITQD